MEGGDLTSKNRSSLIKNTGALSSPPVVHSVHRQKEIAELSINVFIQKPARLILDPRLSLADKAFWGAVKLLEFIFGKCNEPLDVISACACISKRQAIDSSKVLISTGWLSRTRAKWSSSPDTLATVEPKVRKRESRAKEPGKCYRCHAERPLDTLGVCIVCRKQDIAERDVVQVLKQRGPCDWPVVWAVLHADGTKATRAMAHAAYLKAIDGKINISA